MWGLGLLTSRVSKPRRALGLSGLGFKFARMCSGVESLGFRG